MSVQTLVRSPFLPQDTCLDPLQTPCAQWPELPTGAQGPCCGSVQSRTLRRHLAFQILLCPLSMKVSSIKTLLAVPRSFKLLLNDRRCDKRIGREGANGLAHSLNDDLLLVLSSQNHSRASHGSQETEDKVARP